jgi:hypothetical protein
VAIRTRSGTLASVGHTRNAKATRGDRLRDQHSSQVYHWRAELEAP